MKFFRLDLLTLLISLFILNSCKNQDAVGLGVGNSNQQNTNMIDTSTIVVNTVPEDSVVTSSLAKNPLTYFIDPAFGTSISSIATDLNLPGQGAYTLPTGTISIDSARLILNYANGFYGDSITSVYTVDVFQLNEKYNTGIKYYNTKIWNYNANALLGSLTFNARPNDSIKVFDIIEGAPDTLIKVVPQIRIPISTSFINVNFFGATSFVLGSNSVFQNNIKGLYITIDRSKSKGSGGTLMFAGTDTLAVYYRAVNGTIIDTSEVKLPVANTAVSIQHTYSTAVQTELANTTTGSRNLFYLQGLLGLRAKISFPHLLANFRKKLLPDSDVVIDRAELVITPAIGSYIPFTPIPKISMYRLDLALQREELQDATSTDPRSGGESVFGGYYTSAENEYHFIITAYLQDLLLGRTVDYGTYIGPIDNTNTSAVDIDATPDVASRTVAVGSNASPYRIRLNIIYTKVHK